MQVGPAGVGKSQLCHMLAVSALLPQVQQQQANAQAQAHAPSAAAYMLLPMLHYMCYA